MISQARAEQEPPLRLVEPGLPAAFSGSQQMKDGGLAMINFLGCSAQGIAVANGVTTVALLEHMVQRKVLTRSEVRAILRSGIECLEPRTNVPIVAEAVHLMRDQMLPLFAEEFKQHGVTVRRLNVRYGSLPGY